ARPDNSGELAVPAGLRHVDAHTATHRDAFASQQRELARSLMLCTRPVVVQHAVPRHLAPPPGHHGADRSCAAGADVVRDVAVGHHPPPRDAVDRIEYAVSERSHLAVHAGGYDDNVAGMRILVIGGT